MVTERAEIQKLRDGYHRQTALIRESFWRHPDMIVLELAKARARYVRDKALIESMFAEVKA